MLKYIVLSMCILLTAQAEAFSKHSIRIYKYNGKYKTKSIHDSRIHTVLDKHAIHDLLNLYIKYYPEKANRAQPKFNDIVNEASSKYRVEPKLVHAIIQTESAYNPNAYSSKGAAGLMQLMPATAKRFGVVNRRNPKESIHGGVKYIRFLLDMFKDKKLAVAAYNAGEGAVIKYNYHVPPYPETRNYVARVLSLYNNS